MRNHPALKTAILLAIGIALNHLFKLDIQTSLICCIIPIIAWLVVQRIKWDIRIGSILFLLTIIGFGTFYANFRTRILTANHISHFFGQSDCRTSGYLIRDPIRKSNRTDLYIDTYAITRGDTIRSCEGRLLVQIRNTTSLNLKYGDIIEIEGDLVRPRERRNPGGFDYRAYLARQNIHAILYVNQDDNLHQLKGQKGNFLLRRVIYPVRRKLLQDIDVLLPESTRPLLKTLLLGDRTELDHEMRDAYARAGIVHILAVSGLHVGFIALILSFLFGLIRLPWKSRTFFIIAGLLFYVLLTEGRPPVFRAALMASIYLFGQLLDRRTTPLNAVGAAGLFLLLINPARLFDPGFQLSFAAVISILIFYPRLSEWIIPGISIRKRWINKPVKGIVSLIILSFSAQLGTLPLTLTYFNRLPVLALFFNTLAIPLAGLIVALGFTTLLFAQFSMWMAGSFSILTHLLIRLLNKLVEHTASLPFASFTLPSPDLWIICFYVLILSAIFFWKQKTLRYSIILTCLIILNGQMWLNVFRNSDNKLTYLQFDVGQGDAALILCPRNKTILIDGGPAYETFDAGERIIAPYLIREGIRTIDLMICTHPHNDHVGGLNYILDHFRVKSILISASKYESDLAVSFINRIKETGIQHRTIIAPDSLVSFPGIHLLFLGPDSLHFTSLNRRMKNLNNQSIVTLLIHGRAACLLTGDAEKEAEQTMMRRWTDLDCDLLKVGHHGSKTSSSEAWIDAVQPDHALISVAERNRYGLPDDCIINRYLEHGIQIHRTDRDGALLFESDGNTLNQLKW